MNYFSKTIFLLRFCHSIANFLLFYLIDCLSNAFAEPKVEPTAREKLRSILWTAYQRRTMQFKRKSLLRTRRLMSERGQFDYEYVPLPEMKKHVYDFSNPKSKSVPVHLLYQYMKSKTIKRKLRKDLKYKVKQQRKLRKKASDWTPPEASSTFPEFLPEFFFKSNVFISGIWRLLTGIWRLLWSHLESHLGRYFGLFKSILICFNVNYIILSVR